MALRIREATTTIFSHMPLYVEIYVVTECMQYEYVLLLQYEWMFPLMLCFCMHARMHYVWPMHNCL